MTAFWRFLRLNPLASIAVAVGVLILSLLLWQQWRNRRTDEDVGKWKAIAQRLQADSARAAGEIRRVDSVYTKDTVTLRTVLNRYVTTRDTIIARLTDTVKVREFVATADSTIAACRIAVTSCEARVAARDSLLRIAGRQRIADRSLFGAQLRRANPRVLPYAEALADPNDRGNVFLRAGMELRTVGHIRLVAAGQYVTTGDHRLRALAGVRITF